MDCRHHPTCPGCPLADRPYAAQLKAKASRLRRAVGRFGHLPRPAPIVGSQWTEAYRHRLKLPIHHGDKVSIGLYEETRRGRRVLHTPDCPVLADGLRDAIPPILRWLRGRKGVHSLDLRVSEATGELQAVFACRGGELPGGPRAARALLREVDGMASVAVSTADKAGRRVMGSRPKVIAGKAVIEEAIGSTRYDLLPGSFFQADPRQAEVMHRLVRDAVGSATSVLDLYSGVGAYGLMLADGRRVEMVEEVRQAAESARRRAPKGVTVHTSRVEDMRFKGSFDVVILNPARRGSDPASLERIAKLGRKLVYVSCGPETLARDLDVLAAHGMRTTSLTPIDLFPQTREVETVAVLERGEQHRVWQVPGGSIQGPVPTGISGARGRPGLIWMLAIGRIHAGKGRSARWRPLGEVATHTLLAVETRAPVDRALDELRKRGIQAAGEHAKTAPFFAEKAGLQRPFIHVAQAGSVRAPLHGDLALALIALGAPRKLVDQLDAGK